MHKKEKGLKVMLQSKNPFNYFLFPKLMHKFNYQ